MSRQNILYRCFSELGACLYIGMTTQPGVRLRKHAESKDWWSEVAFIELKHYRTKDALEKAEKAAILAASPVYNTHHNNPRAKQQIEEDLDDLCECDFCDDADECNECDVCSNRTGEYVIVEYDGPEIELTESERAESRAAAEVLGKYLCGEAS